MDVAICTEHGGLEIDTFRIVARLFVHSVRNQLEALWGNVAELYTQTVYNILNHKLYIQHSNIIGVQYEFIQHV